MKQRHKLICQIVDHPGRYDEFHEEHHLCHRLAMITNERASPCINIRPSAELTLPSFAERFRYQGNFMGLKLPPEVLDRIFTICRDDFQVSVSEPNRSR